ncbi:MAG: DUF3696 domain-containing protein [Cyanobacteria bacterium P01_C01_bin.121]
MLETLRFQNFKSWRDTGDIKLAPITGLFGTNSSGKSSILQFLLMLKQTVESADMNRILHTGNSNTYVNLGSTRSFIHKNDLPNYLCFSLCWKPNKSVLLPTGALSKYGEPFGGIPSYEEYKDVLALRCNLSIELDDLNVNAISYVFKSNRGVENIIGEECIPGSEFPKKYKLFSDGDVSPLVAKQYENHVIAPFKSYGLSTRIGIAITNYIVNLVSSFEIQMREVYYLGPLRDYPRRLYSWSGEMPQSVGNRGEDTILALLASRRQDTYVEEQVAKWLRRLGLIHSFRLSPIAENRQEYEIRVQKTSDSTETTIADVGFGVSQILPVLVLCYYVPEGSIIILEQPEIHLHPSVQAGLADLFVEVQKTRNVQIIVESHSEHLLRRLQLNVAKAELINQEQTALYFCDMDDNGESHLMPLEIDTYGNINNWPEGFFGDEIGDLVEMTEVAMQRQAASAES